MESLNQFLLNELKVVLLEQYARIQFPFEDTVDYLNKNVSYNLNYTIQILECLDFINESSDQKY